MALDGRRIDNVIRDFMPRYPHDQQPAGLAKGKLRRPKPLEVFTEDNGSTFGYLIGKASKDDKFLFQPAGSEDAIVISGDLPATKATKQQVTTAANALAVA